MINKIEVNTKIHIHKNTKAKKMKKNMLLTRYIVLSIVCIISVFPLIWIGYNSLKTNSEFFLDVWSLPSALHFGNFTSAWSKANFSLFFKNSFIVTFGATLLCLLFGSMAAFVISRFPFPKLNKWMFTFFAIGLLIPGNTLLIPVYKMVINLGLIDTYWSMILTYTAFNLPVSIFILSAGMKAIPKEIEESALMDGCSILRIFFKLIIPLSLPAISTVAILNIINNWNELIFALLFTSDENIRTIPVALTTFTGAYQTNFVLMFSAIIISIIPVIVAFVILQENVIKGVTSGAVKG